MTKSEPHNALRARRHRLAVTTALAGLLVVTPAWAQTLTAPKLSGPNDVHSTTPGSVLGGAPFIDKNGNTLDVTLNATNTIIDWNGFNIPTDGTANFHGTLLNALTQLAVLNRDISGNVSQILGKLNSSSNVAVWILNPNGIMIGSKANINTGSLVLSTLGINDADFRRNGNNTFALTPTLAQSAITVSKGAVVNINGNNRGLVMVAPKIDAYGQFDARDQSVAFVAASDVQLTFTQGSPLSVKINQGTAVSGTSLFVRGTVAGADALFALASKASVTDALLRVDASVTTATSGTRGIVLSAGRLADAIDGVTVAGTAAAAGGVAKLEVNGDLTTRDNDGSDILAGATGTATFSGKLVSQRDIRLSAAGNIAVQNDVTAGGNYSVDGLKVTLGNGTEVTQKADGAIDITANRALTGLNGLTLEANADGSHDHPESLTLAATYDGIEHLPDGTSTIGPAGTINFQPGTTLKGGDDRESSVRIRSGGASGALWLGKVVAHDLLGAVGTNDFSVGITRQTGLTTGDLSLIGQIKLDGTTLKTGALTSDNAVTLNSLGNITTGAIQSGKIVTIVAGGSLDTRGIDSGGGLSADAVGTAIFRGDVDAQGDLGIRAASVTLNGKTTSSGSIDLLGRSGAINAGDLQASKAVTLTTTGPLAVGAVTSGGDITADATGDAKFGGDLAASGDLLLHAASIKLNGQTAKSGGTIDLLARVGGISSAAGLDIESTSTDTHEFVRLQATGAQGINLTSTSHITAGANQALRVAVRNETDGAALILGDVDARALVGLSAANGDPATMAVPIVSSGSLTFGNLNLVDSFSAASTAGDLNVSSIAVTGKNQEISLSASLGELAVQSNISADGNVTLVSGSSLSAGKVESRAGQASVTSAGSVDLDALLGFKKVVATGTSVAIGSVGGGAVDIAATAGGITLGDVGGGNVNLGATGGDIVVNDALSSTGAVSATATGAVSFANDVTASGGGITVRSGTGAASLLGDVKAAGDYRVTGQSVMLGGKQQADGAVAITATGGAIVGKSGLVITSDANDSGAESLMLNATGGGISLAGDSLLAGGSEGHSAVTVTTDAGSVGLGDVTARSLMITGVTQPIVTISTGDLNLSDALTAIAGKGVTTGTIDVIHGGVTIDGGIGAVDTGTIKAANAVSLTGASVNYDAITGSGVAIAASSGDIVGHDITSNGSIALAAGSGKITAGKLVASGQDGNVTLTSGGALFATSVTAGGTAILTTSGSDADISLAEGLTASGDVSVAAGRDIRAPFITSLDGALTISAPNGDVTGYQPGSDIALNAGDGKAFSLTVSGNVNLGDIGGGAISITAAGIVIGSIDADDNAVSLTANHGDLTVGGDIVAGDTSLSATGMTNLNAITATGAVSLSGGTGIRFTDISATAVTAASNGSISGNSVRAAGALTMSGDELSLGQASAGEALTLTATGGDAVLGALSSGQNTTILAAGRAAVNGDVEVGGNYTVTGGSVTLGNDAVTQRAAGAIAITAKNGDIDGAAGLTLVNASADGGTGPSITLDSAGAINLLGSTLQTSGALGLRAGVGQSVLLGRIEAGVIGGFDGTTIGGAFNHAGSVTTGDISTGNIDVALSSGDLTTGAVTASGAIKLAAATGGIDTGALEGASIDLAAGGTVSATSLVTPGSATLAGGEIRVDTVRAGSIGIKTIGAVTGNASDRASLTSTVGDISVEGGDLRLGTVDSAGALALDGDNVDISGKLMASRQLLVKARAALTMMDASAGGDLSLNAADATTAGSLTSGGAITVAGRGITVGAAHAAGALSLTSGADLRLGSGQAGGAATMDAAGLASLGALSAGPSITVRAADAALTGVQRAAAVTFQNTASATSAMRLGDDTSANGFRLSNAEVALIDADAVRFDQGSGAMQIGALAFGANTGRRTVDLLTTGAIAVDGTVTGDGLGRVFRIGGDAGDGAASDIRVTATSSGGGRLLFNNADLDLRGDRIAVGLASGFLDALAPGEAGDAQALAFISDSNSALYNAGLGGAVYDPSATTIVSAHTLNVRFADFALFQNTGVPGRFSGVVLGGTSTMPALPALRVSGTGNPINAAFALFGTVNGAGDASAALLGSGVIDIDSALLPNSRINGCLAGSGAGCLTTIVIQPVLQIFDWSSDDVFGVTQDVSTPFDPVVGGNNEELLTGLPALAPDRQTSREGAQQ